MPGGLCASTEAEKQLIILSVHSAEKNLCRIFSYRGRSLVATLQTPQNYYLSAVFGQEHPPGSLLAHPISITLIMYAQLHHR